MCAFVCSKQLDMITTSQMMWGGAVALVAPHPTSLAGLGYLVVLVAPRSCWLVSLEGGSTRTLQLHTDVIVELFYLLWLFTTNKGIHWGNFRNVYYFADSWKVDEQSSRRKYCTSRITSEKNYIRLILFSATIFENNFQWVRRCHREPVNSAWWVILLMGTAWTEMQCGGSC